MSIRLPTEAVLSIQGSDGVWQQVSPSAPLRSMFYILWGESLEAWRHRNQVEAHRRGGDALRGWLRHDSVFNDDAPWRFDVGHELVLPERAPERALAAGVRA